MEQLDGKVGVITGAASGIGRAMALTFAAEGMHLALADIETEPLEETAELVRAEGVNALSVPTDVSDPAAVEHLNERSRNLVHSTWHATTPESPVVASPGRSTWRPGTGYSVSTCSG